MLVTLTGFCSLAVDLGRVQLAKSELRLAADAAARHAAHTFVATNSVASARAAAVDSADDNTADGANAVVLDPTLDVLFGTWNSATKTFTAAAAGSESSATAVQVTARRTAARGNPVSLAFARVIGRGTADVTARAVARINSRRPGIVGLDSITMSGSSGVGNRTDSFRSKAGPATTYGRGSIWSNGNISLSGNSQIRGDARPGPGKSVTVSGGASLSGSNAPLPKALSYPAEPAGTAATSNDNWRVPSANLNSSGDFAVGSSSNLTLAGGVYHFRTIQIGANGVVSFTGVARVVVTDSVQIAGTVRAKDDVPGNLRLVLTGSATSTTDFAMSSDASVHADLYAPLSAFKASGSATLYGSVVAKSIDMSGSARVLFDESLTVTAPGVSLVQ